MTKDQFKKTFVHIAANTIGDQPTPGTIKTLCGKEVVEKIVNLPAGEIQICPDCSKKLREIGVVPQFALVLNVPLSQESAIS
jgi:hypothetical protein